MNDIQLYIAAAAVVDIVPHLHTPGMFSWFPMYFPIKART